MNKLIEFFAKQHLFVNLLSLFAVVLGVIAVLNIKREEYPNINFDLVIVTTTFPNTSAESIEKLITIPLEAKINEIDGIKEMTSVSIEGRSVINLQLDPDQIDVDDAKDEIQSSIDTFKELPKGAETPLVVKIGNKTQGLIELALFSDVSVVRVRELTKNLKRVIERIEGVATVEYEGLPKFEYLIEADPIKLKEYHLGLTQVLNKIQLANLEIPGGTLLMSKNGHEEEFVIKTVSNFEDKKTLETLVLKSNLNGQFVRLKDVASVRYQFADQEILYRSNGKRGINLMVYKKSSADTIDLVDQLKIKVADFQKSIPDLEIKYFNDRSTRVRLRVSVLSNNLLIGLVLVVIILSLMLPLRMALITSLGIPFSFLITLAIFHYAGISLNLISMMGLIIVIGMVVDDAIVVTENAQSKLEEGMSSEQAAIEGAKEVWKPITTSILTSLAAFLPLMFMSGIFGKFVFNLPIGVIICLLISLFECYFILPSHIASWVRYKPKKNRKISFLYFWNNIVVPAYEKSLVFCIRFKYIFTILITVLFVYSIYFARQNIPFKLFPGSENLNFSLNVETPIGTSLEKTEELSKKIEDLIIRKAGENLEFVSSTVGFSNERQPGMSISNIASNIIQIKTYLQSETGDTKLVHKLIEELKKDIGDFPSLHSYHFSKGKSGPPVGKAVNIQVISEHNEELLEISKILEKEMYAIKGVTDVDQSMEEGKEEIKIILDEEKLSLANVSKTDVANAVKASFDGIVADQLQISDEEVDIRLTLKKDHKNDFDALKNILIPNKNGTLIRLSNIVQIKKNRTTGNFQHLDSYRYVRIFAEINPKITTSQVANKILRKVVKKLEGQFPGVEFRFGGEEKDRVESFASLKITFIFAFVGIIFLLVLQFNNFSQPILIGMMIPLGIISIIWTFFLHQQALSFLAMIGVIALSGVIVNDAIVFLDFVNQERKKGVSNADSILSAGKKRLRPIFLTTVTTTAGILPTAYGIGGKDFFVIPIALTLGWGVLGGSFLTVFVLPSLISIHDDIKMFFRSIFRSFKKA